MDEAGMKSRILKAKKAAEVLITIFLILTFEFVIIRECPFLSPFMVPAAHASTVQTYWPSDFGYEQNYTIPQTSGAGTNYQQNITIVNASSTSSGYIMGANYHIFTSNFYDVNITSTSGVPLGMWNMTVNPNINITIWFTPTDNLTSGPGTVYVYYGKAGVTVSPYSIGATMIMGDDFRADTSLNATLWTAYPSTSGTWGNISIADWILSKFGIAEFSECISQFIIELRVSADGFKPV
jgi:hypothetical protein